MGRSDSPRVNAYSEKLCEFVTENNRWFNLKQAKNKFIAANYYILSIMQDKYENYPEKQKHHDMEFLDKVKSLHTVETPTALMNAKWSSLRMKIGYGSCLFWSVLALLYLY